MSACFQGVPHLLRQKFMALKTDLLAVEKLPPFHNIALRLAIQDETKIASILEDTSIYAGLEVDIGSYPVSLELSFQETIANHPFEVHHAVYPRCPTRRMGQGLLSA